MTRRPPAPQRHAIRQVRPAPFVDADLGDDDSAGSYADPWHDDTWASHHDTPTGSGYLPAPGPPAAPGQPTGDPWDGHTGAYGPDPTGDPWDGHTGAYGPDPTGDPWAGHTGAYGPDTTDDPWAGRTGAYRPDPTGDPWAGRTGAYRPDPTDALWERDTGAHDLDRTGDLWERDTGAYGPDPIALPAEPRDHDPWPHGPRADDRAGHASGDDDTEAVPPVTPLDRRRRARPVRQEIAPWASRRRGASEQDPAIVSARVGPAPVFVDDSGRRRRLGRLVASTVVVAVAAYTTVIGLNLAGVPLVGNVAPPGLDRLARPAGDTSVVSGEAAEVVPLPPAATGSGSSTTAPEPADGSDAAGDATSATTAPDSTATPSTTTTVPATTTTIVHGRGPTTTVTPTTDPGRGNGGGPPDTPPGQG